jgi:cytochrome c5
MVLLWSLPLTVMLAAEPDGELLYRIYCTACHGIQGNGNGLNVPDMPVQPRDHTDAGEMAARTDDELTRTIINGGPAVGKSALMPPWGAILNDAEVTALVAHLRKLSNTDSDEPGKQVADVPAGDDTVQHNLASPGTASGTTSPGLVVTGPMEAAAPAPPEELLKRYPEAKTHRFEIRVEERLLTVAPGFKTKVWGFNGQVPGPLLRVREGDEVIVDFVNLSSAEHTIHWHGMHQEHSWQSDGVPNVTQFPVPAGGKYTYHFVATRPGTLWYHCHVNVPEHVGLRGMWAPFIVDPLRPEPIEEIVTKEAILMFSGWNSEVADRFGVGGHPTEKQDYFSINGKSFPLTQPLRVKQGDVLRLRLFGAGNDVSFHLHGHDILVTHKDGLPLAQPFYADVLFIEQGARYDAIVRMNNPGLWINHDHIEHHVSNAGKTPGGAVLVVEYDSIEKPDWYIWKDLDYDPNFYYSESLRQGYGMFEHAGFRGEEIPLGR